MSRPASIRIDSARPATPPPSAPRSGPVAAVAKNSGRLADQVSGIGASASHDRPVTHDSLAQASVDTCEPPAHSSDCKGWLRLHADDLIARLRTWAIELDAREARLNARESLVEHRERCLRLEQQQSAGDLSEQRRSLQRWQRELESQARRLAFEAPELDGRDR